MGGFFCVCMGGGGRGGAKGMLASPLPKLLGGGRPGPAWPPSSYAYGKEQRM